MMDTIQLQSTGLPALGTLAIGAIAFAPSNPSIVYIGTGEQNTGYFGSGLYRMDNATAATPTLVGPINPTADYGDGMAPTFSFRAISQIQVHPTQPGTIFVSTSEGKGGIVTHNDSRPPNAIPPMGTMGLYRTTNATNAPNAVTFTKLRLNMQDGFTTGNTDISDIILDPSDVTANTLLAWVRSGDGANSMCVPGGNCSGLFRTTNAMGLGTFTQPLVALTQGLRGELAVAQVGPTVTVLAATAERPATAPNPNPNSCAADHHGLVRRSLTAAPPGRTPTPPPPAKAASSAPPTASAARNVSTTSRSTSIPPTPASFKSAAAETTAAARRSTSARPTASLSPKISAVCTPTCMPWRSRLRTARSCGRATTAASSAPPIPVRPG